MKLLQMAWGLFDRCTEAIRQHNLTQVLLCFVDHGDLKLVRNAFSCENYLVSCALAHTLIIDKIKWLGQHLQEFFHGN